MFGRRADWWARLWNRDSRRSLELRVRALHARTEDVARAVGCEDRVRTLAAYERWVGVEPTM